MIVDLIKNYNGECVIDHFGSYSFSNAYDQIEKFKKLFIERVQKNDRVLIYSDYTFQSISLLLSLSDLNINIIPLVKTTESEYQEKLESVKPNWIFSFDNQQNLLIEHVRS